MRTVTVGLLLVILLRGAAVAQTGDSQEGTGDSVKPHGGAEARLPTLSELASLPSTLQTTAQFWWVFHKVCLDCGVDPATVKFWSIREGTGGASTQATALAEKSGVSIKWGTSVTNYNFGCGVESFSALAEGLQAQLGRPVCSQVNGNTAGITFVVPRAFPVPSTRQDRDEGRAGPAVDTTVLCIEFLASWGNAPFPESIQRMIDRHPLPDD